MTATSEEPLPSPPPSPANTLRRWLWRNRRGEVRAIWRIVLYLALAGAALTACFALLPGGGLDSLAGLALMLPGYGVAVLALLLIAWWLLRWLDDAPRSSLGLSWHARAHLELGQGLALGALLMTPLFVVSLLAGWIGVELRTPPALGTLAVVTALLMLAASFEELIFRGYVFQVLIQGMGVWPAVLASSLVFGAAHNANPGATTMSFVNTTLAGLLLALAYLRVRSLWLPIALHFGWNYCQGPIFGLPVSGIEVPTSVLTASVTDDGAGAAWLNGGDYGPEAGLLLTVLVTAAALGVYGSSFLRPAPAVDPIWVPATAHPAAPADDTSASSSPVSGKPA